LKVLLDHNLDRRLSRHLPDYECATAYELGWANVSNGRLLSLAETNGFDVLLTADTNIKTQRNFAGRKIAVLVLRAYNNRLSTHLEMLDEVEVALSGIRPGQIREVFHSEMKRKRP